MSMKGMAETVLFLLLQDIFLQQGMIMKSMMITQPGLELTMMTPLLRMRRDLTMRMSRVGMDLTMMMSRVSMARTMPLDKTGTGRALSRAQAGGGSLASVLVREEGDSSNSNQRGEASRDN